jgi:hypothetical protein
MPVFKINTHRARKNGAGVYWFRNILLLLHPDTQINNQIITTQ